MTGTQRSNAQGPRPADDSEETLAGLARAGCRASFERLAERVRPRLVYVLQRRTRTHADAEDAAQQSLLRAWEQLQRYEPSRRFMPWLLTIALRLAVDQSRQQRRRVGLVQTLGGMTPRSHDTRPDHGLLERERCNDVWGAAQRVLSEPQWTALWLHYGESMSPGEVAKAMGRTTVATRVLLHRARQTLKPHLLRWSDASDTATLNSNTGTLGSQLRWTGAQS